MSESQAPKKDNQPQDTDSGDTPKDVSATDRPPRRPPWWKNRKVWLYNGLGILVVILVIMILALGRGGGEPFPLPGTSPTPKPTPAEVASKLDGTLVSLDAALRHPLAITVENLPPVRPQTGLSSASLIYEAIVEGGITRFLAVYGPTLPERVGPVRSSRQVFVDLIKEFTPTSAYYAHVGGAPDAQAALKNQKLYDLDQFSVGAKAYERFAKAGVASEHTMYTYPSKLYAVAKDRGYASQSSYRPWLFKKDTDITNRPAAQTITIGFGNASYDVVYVYDRVANTYRRQQQGKDFTDTLTGKALTPKNVVAQFVSYSTRKGDDKGRQDVDLASGGNAKVFLDGSVIEAKWSKDKATNRTLYTNAATGKEIEFNAGQTIVELIKLDAKVGVETTAASPTPTPKPSPSP